MTYVIEFTPDAQEHLANFAARERANVLDAVEAQLQYEPTVEIRQRKRMRPNAACLLGAAGGKLRVFYDVNESEQTVEILAIGKKERERLFIGNREFLL